MDWGNSHQRRTILVTRVTFHGLFKADVSKFCSESLRYQSPSSLPPKSAWKGLTWAMWGRIAGLAVLISWSRDLPPSWLEKLSSFKPPDQRYLPASPRCAAVRKKIQKLKMQKYKIQNTKYRNGLFKTVSSHLLLCYCQERKWNRSSEKHRQTWSGTLYWESWKFV